MCAPGLAQGIGSAVEGLQLASIDIVEKLLYGSAVEVWPAEHMEQPEADDGVAVLKQRDEFDRRGRFAARHAVEGESAQRSECS